MLKEMKKLSFLYKNILNVDINFLNNSYLITSKCPRSKLHYARLLIKREIRHIDCTRTLQQKKLYFDKYFNVYNIDM